MDNKTKGGLLDYDAAKKLFERIIREKVGKGLRPPGAFAFPSRSGASDAAERARFCRAFPASAGITD